MGIIDVVGMDVGVVLPPRNLMRARSFSIALILMGSLMLGRFALASEPAEIDSDQDGLSDRLELLFQTDIHNSDSDGDGYPDGVEVTNGYDPASSSSRLLLKDIVVHTSTQRMEQRLNGVVIATHLVSTGTKSLPTPLGTFKIMSKNKRAWSRIGKLWMPYWMQITKTGVGIHELPEWPNGKKEGADHLGKPASHGCIRLGVGPAKAVYDWAPVGTTVKVVK